MAKDLPYFKFFCSEWNDGDITLEDYEIQGLFINICSYYWSNECCVKIDKLFKKFRHVPVSYIDTLLNANVMKVDVDENLCITFLDEQLEERIEQSKNKSKGGKASAEARRLKKSQQETNRKSTESQQMLNSCSTESQLLREDKIREEEKKEDKIIKPKKFIFLNSLIDNGAKKELATEWIKVRKNKKATNSETALKGFLSQVYKSKLNINQVLEQCVIRSWGGFNAEWLKDIKPQDVNIDKEDVVTFYWEHEGRSNKRTISKDKANDYFTKQAVGGYKAIVL